MSLPYMPSNSSAGVIKPIPCWRVDYLARKNMYQGAAEAAYDTAAIAEAI